MLGKDVRVLAFSTCVAAAACGGRTPGPIGTGSQEAQDGAASTADSSGSPSTSPTTGGTSSGPGGNGSTEPGGPPSGSSSSGSAGAPSCSPSVLDFGSDSSCWSCVSKGCATQLQACAQDCVCNSAMLTALACATSAGVTPSCFASASRDSAFGAASLCVVTAGAECNCLSGPADAMAPAAPDASVACVQTGGGGSAGNGECTSTIGETCGGAQYDVVCECPRGSCVCFGDTTTVIPYSGCPYCPLPGVGGPGSATATELLAACGFPH